MAEGYGDDSVVVLGSVKITQGRNFCHVQSNEESGSIHTIEYC